MVIRKCMEDEAMYTITAKQLAQIVGGELLSGAQDAPLCGLSTDSRTVAEGELFVPLKGDTFDGHDYIEKALENGAAGCLCARVPERVLDSKFYIRVDDPLRAMKPLALWYRKQFDIPFVQITGSTGKTTAKEMVWGVLSQKYRTLKTEENFNGDIGTPQILLKLDQTHEAAVIESGMDHAGEIRYLGEMVLPGIAAIINVGVAHIEFLGSRENILKAKCEILENLASDGVAFLNGDDELLNTVTPVQRCVRFGLGENCSVRVVDFEARGLEGTRCTVKTEKDTYELSIPAPGEHMIYPAALSVAVGEEMGLSHEEIVRGIASYAPVGARMRILRFPGERVLLDDCYNANPQSMGAALRVLANSGGKKRIAVLGNMGELGELYEQAHRDMGALTGELGIDTLFAICPLAEQMAEEAKKHGCKEVYTFATKDEAYEKIYNAYCEGAVMLLKASHYTGRFEYITEYLEKKLGTAEK